MVESQSSIEMKVGKGSGEDLVEKMEKDLDPSSNLHNVKISKCLKSFEKKNNNISATALHVTGGFLPKPRRTTPALPRR